MTMGERIALLRKQAGLSQEQLGEQLGVSRQAVSKWESGQTSPDIQYIMALCRLFRVTSDYLLFGTDCGEERKEVPEDRKGPAEDTYCVVLEQTAFWREIQDAIFDLFHIEGVRPEFALEGEMTRDVARDLVTQGPMVLCRGLDREQAARALKVIWQNMAGHLLVYREGDGATAEELISGAEPLRREDFPETQEKRQPMSFGATVFAVALGVVAAVLLLSFL